MRRVVHLVLGAVLVAAVVFVPEFAAAGGQPVVSSVIEGRDPVANRATLALMGKKVSKFKTFQLVDEGGADAGSCQLLFKSSSLVVVATPVGTPAGSYDLFMTFGKKGTATQAVEISNGFVPPGSIEEGALTAALRDEIHSASSLTRGHLNTALFSAYDDLFAEGKVGPGVSQIAAGAHGHGSEYISRGGGTGIGSLSLTGPLAARQTGTTGRAVFGDATSSTGSVAGVRGDAASPNGVGAVGFNTATTGTAVGVAGQTASVNGQGVRGTATATTGLAFGVLGQAESVAGVGVYGESTSQSGNCVGVMGSSESVEGGGVFGFNTATTGTGIGVAGASDSDEGIGVKGVAYSTTGATTGVYALSDSSAGDGVYAEATSTTGYTYGVRSVNRSASGIALYGSSTSTTGTAWGVFGHSASSGGIGVLARSTGSGSASTGLWADHTGSAGDIAVFSSSYSAKARINKSGTGYFDGGTYIGGADFAESVNVDGPPSAFEPGDVMVIDTEGVRRFTISTEASSPLVAGIYSTKPGVLARNGNVAGGEPPENEIPLAVTGIVPCKVCDENGPIRTGDLLVAASLPGHAMKAPTDPVAGTILAKALAPLAEGVGKIEVLITMR